MNTIDEVIILSLIAGLMSYVHIYYIIDTSISINLNDVYLVMLMTGWLMMFTAILNRNTNRFIIAITLIFTFAYLFKDQTFINNHGYLTSVLPRHDIEILMSKKILERTNNKDIINLANKTIQDNTNEKNLIKKILKNDLKKNN